MFKSYFERNDMERVIWYIMTAYDSLFMDKSYNDGSVSMGFLFGEITVVGCHWYAKERGLSSDFIHFTCDLINKHIIKYNTISLEIVCFSAASLRGDFDRQHKKIGQFFGINARKLGLDRNVFNSYNCQFDSFMMGVASASSRI